MRSRSAETLPTMRAAELTPAPRADDEQLSVMVARQPRERFGRLPAGDAHEGVLGEVVVVHERPQIMQLARASEASHSRRLAIHVRDHRRQPESMRDARSDRRGTRTPTGQLETADDDVAHLVPPLT